MSLWNLICRKLECGTIRFQLADLWSREDNLACISERDLSESSEMWNRHGQDVLDALVITLD